MPILDAQNRLAGLLTHESLRQISRPIDLLRLRLVSEVMTHQVICAAPENSMLAITQQMAEHRVSSVMIVQPGGSPDQPHVIPVGIVTERDIVQFQALGLNLETCVAEAVMSTPIFAVQPSDSLWVVQQMMEQRLIRRLAVTGAQGELLGIVTQTSLLQAFNPLELYRLAETLEEKVEKLEAEKLHLLENRALELEQQVISRTASLRTKAEKDQLVMALATQIRSSLRLQTILDTAVEQVRQVLGCERVNIWRVEADWQTVVVAESTDSSYSLLGERVNDTCFQSQQAEIYHPGHVRIISDIYEAEMTDCHRELLVRLQTRAKILVPLFCGDQLWGLLNASEGQQARHWGAEEVELLQALAMQLAIALQQATMYQKLQDELFERQQTEQALRESESRWQFALEGAGDGLWDWNLQTNHVFFSHQWKAMLGYADDEIGASAEEWGNRLHPEDRTRVLIDIQKYLAGETQAYHNEHRVCCKDGSYKWILDRGKIIERTAEGQPLRMIGTHSDINSRKQTELALQNLIAGTAATTGENFFPALAQHIAEALQVSYALVTELVDGNLQALAFCAHGALQPTFSYHPARTPCERTLQDGQFYCGCFIQQLFPDDLDLVEMAAYSYLGIALRDVNGTAIGNLCVLDQQTIQDPERAEQILRVFAARAAAEIERQRTSRALQQLNQTLEQRVEQRTLEVQEREAQLQDFFDSANDLIQMVSLANGRFEYVNRAWREVLGYSEAEIADLTLFDLVHPDYHQHCHEMLAEMQAGRLPLVEQIELKFLSRQQQEVILEGSLNCRFVDGQAVATRAIFRDITTRKQAELAQRESQQLLQTVLDTFPLAVFWKDRNSVFLGANLVLAQAAGFDSAIQVIGKTDDEMPWAGTEAESYRSDDRRVMESGIAKLGIIETLTRADGSQIWLETNKIPLRDLDGHIIGVMGTFQDISDRKQAEQTIHRQAIQEKLLREITQRIRQSLDIPTIFDTACEEIRSVLHTDRVGIFQFYPDSNFDDGEFVAESVVEGFPSVLAIRVHDHCFGENYSTLYSQGRTYAADDIHNSDMTTCHTDILSQFQVQANLIVPLICGQDLWGLLCLHQCATTRHWKQTEIEFTQQLGNQLAIAIQQAKLYERIQAELVERQQAETRLTETNHQLARATRLKDEFLANMSHELRTPLNAILGMTEGLQEQVFGSINERQLKALQTVERSGSHLLELINDILDVSKIEAGQIELNYSPISIAHLCHSSLAFIKQQALQKRIQLEIKLQPNLPDLLVDERRIRQVLINLLNNAVKFTPAGGRITLETSVISVHSDPPNPSGASNPDAADFASPACLRIAVRDTGIGIAPEQIHKLFQPFMQIDSALNRQYEGTGLGLALVKRLTELHGGRVILTSEKGVGSCFTIELPYSLDALDSSNSLIGKFTDEYPSELTSSTVTNSNTNAATNTVSSVPVILLVEDNEANINTISSYLKAKGYQILSAKDGQAGIELAKARQPDVIMMDIQMPGIDGLEATRQLRLDPDLADTPIIALTALAMTGDREKCLAAGANEYLTKPVRLKELFQMLQTLLER